MLLALVKDDELVKYPYTIGEFQQNNPNVSLPDVLDNATLNAFGLFRVIKTTPPDQTFENVVSEGVPELKDGKWYQTWTSVDRTDDEVSAILKSNKEAAYREESDALFFKWQRGEATKEEWLNKVNEIKQRYERNAFRATIKARIKPSMRKGEAE